MTAGLLDGIRIITEIRQAENCSWDEAKAIWQRDVEEAIGAAQPAESNVVYGVDFCRVRKSGNGPEAA